MRVKLVIPDSTKLGIAIGALGTYALIGKAPRDGKKAVKNAAGKIGKKLTNYAEK